MTHEATMSAHDQRLKRQRDLLEELHRRPGVPEGHLIALKKLMRADPAFETPHQLLPVDEAAAKLDYARQIEKRIRKHYPPAPDFRFNQTQIALVAILPLSSFKDGGNLSPKRAAMDLYHALELIVHLLKHFLLKWTNKSYLGHVASSNMAGGASVSGTRVSSRKKRKPSSRADQAAEEDTSERDDVIEEEQEQGKHGGSDDEYVSPSANRSDFEKAQCRRRDGNACILTNMSDPDVCHIVPFGWNDDQAAIRKTNYVMSACGSLLSQDWLDQYHVHLANASEPGGSDKSWNMICLNKQLHQYWGKALFALKFLGIDTDTEDEAIVKIQFHWMPRSKKDPMALCSLTGKNNDLNKMMDSAKTFRDNGSHPAVQPSGKLGAFHVDSGSPLLTGQLFYVRLPTEDAIRFGDMLKLQWACIVSASLSGGAEAPHLLPDHPKWGDSKLRTMAWVEDQARRDVARPPPNVAVPMPIRPQQYGLGPLESISNLPKQEDPSQKQWKTEEQSQKTRVEEPVTTGQDCVSENAPPTTRWQT
ncbi:hypothetical protein B0T10DRAFT_228300 [Thelonectria olida]|uniref:HNH nuclease domain-containing protein n=1 Tax=Thelonectria olida TaxID=1576542 RepID=A0A9P9AU38_9HYPO|nr:hypothetical protein B0T10DRAFT_228300 [Thelonectria olida]